MHKRWRLVHILNWEAVHGPLPPGHLLHFLDGNRMNTSAENLEMVSRADWLKRHTIHNYPKEIFQVTQLRGAVTRRIKRLEKTHG
ncbi:MAG: HNH endonuclease [Hydrogenophilales bacterium]|nr:HNH endonuclease [Hydrogenophilales bacterium]